MISIRCSALLALLALASTAFASDLSTCPGQTCPEDNFIFTCTGSGEVTWVIENASGVQVTNYTVVENELTVGGNDTFGDMDQFMVRRLAENSTRLWFRANPNYNGFKVICDDDDDEMECSLQVFGTPTEPENFVIQSNTVTRTSVRLSWEVPLNYDCMISYYNILVNGVTYNVSSNYTWFDLPVVFGREYCPVISARDAAMRSGQQVATVPRCIDVDYPPAVMLNDNMYSYRAGEFVNITVSWMLPPTNTPAITNYTIRYNETYTNMGSGSGSDDDDDNMRTVTVLAGQTSVMLRGSFRERSTYFVEVIPTNMFGAGAYNRSVFTIPVAPTPSIMPPEFNGGLSVGAIVGIVIGAIVGLILIVVIVVVVIVVIVMVAGRRGKASKPHELTKL